MEHITAFVRPPWWKQIPTQDLIVYTDGSGHDGHIGAVIYSPTIRFIKGEYIGTEDTHNVYTAELMAIQMAITLFEEKIDEHANVYIFKDNQYEIKTVV